MSNPITINIDPRKLIANLSDPVTVAIYIGDDNFFTMMLMAEEDGSLYYHVQEDANPHEVIEGHYPEYFDLTPPGGDW